MQGEVLIVDVEADGLLDTITKLHCIQIGTAEGEDVVLYSDTPLGHHPLQDGLNRIAAADTIIGHNFQRYDIHAINRFYPGTVDPKKVYDTLVVARLLHPDEKRNSLKDWGERLGVAKGDYSGGWEVFTEEMAKYAIQDVHVGRALYRYLKSKAQGWGWDRSIWIENLFAYVISLQEQNGFTLNTAKAIALAGELRQELHDITNELQEIFPPIITERYSAKTGKRLKDGVEVFNPGSGIQVAKRLTDKYGWVPKKYTDTGRPAVDEEVLSSLPYSECKPLLRYLGVQKMLGQIEDGKNGWLKLVDSKTSRVHGAVNTLGAATGRCSHNKPNMAQVSKKDLRMREVWEARPGWKLVGVDAEGLEFRMLAHYLAPRDKGATTEAVLNGDKSKGTDIHSLNRKFCELYLRDTAKGVLYGMVYGASDERLGRFVFDDALAAGKPRPSGSFSAHGARLRKAVGKGTPGLDKLIDDVKAKAKQQGWLKGIDGRKIKLRSPHSAFNFLLQGGGAIAMKVALIFFHFNRVPAKGWVHGVDFAYCANVHDEVQSEVRPEIAEEFGAELADCIREAGEWLGIRCPLAGSSDVGLNWRDTH